MTSPLPSADPKIATSPDWVVTAATMRAIESALFEAGMPVAALMEKVAQQIATWVMATYPRTTYPQVVVLVGPGHNGGDALVVAREMAHRGYGVRVVVPTTRHKDLTASHLHYVRALGVSVSSALPDSHDCQTVDLWIDGLFGFGLERPLDQGMADIIAAVNAHPSPVVSLDIPSGLHTDTGEVLGIAIRATHTLCLGLWKRAFCQDVALPYLGQRHRIDFNIPPFALTAGLNDLPPVRQITTSDALACLPLPRVANCHKYQVGHLLIVAGSGQYAGAAGLAGLGARASGVGMLTLAVPESLRWMVVAQLPEALVIGCPETETGAMADLPTDVANALDRYDAIACGPGLSRQAGGVVDAVLACNCPLVLDADALNHVAQRQPSFTLAQRSAPTVITPHLGEFRRLFPELTLPPLDPSQAAQVAATQNQSIVVLKGACTAIAHPDGQLWLNADSTPGLARGGSGDVLTGLMGGLLAQAFAPFRGARPEVDHHGPKAALDLALDAALAGVWWHSQAAKDVASRHTELGVDGPRLAAALTTTLAATLAAR
jgi:hydroxyethylthiazole kinase-like uncharacterized protein yjeF